MNNLHQWFKPYRALGFMLISIFVLTGVVEAESCVPPPAGLVSWWPGDGNANDIYSNNHGIIEESVTFTTGINREAFSFKGAGFVLVPDNPSLDLTDEITIEFWFNYQNADDFKGLIAKRAQYPENSGTNYGVSVNANFLGFGLYYNDPLVEGGDDFDAAGSPFESSRFLPIPSAGEFHHFAGTYRQITSTRVKLQMFVDGKLVKTKILPGNLVNTINDAPVTLGASYEYEWGELFNGILDEVTLYNRVLSVAEIKAIFNASSAGKCKGSIKTDDKQGTFPNIEH